MVINPELEQVVRQLCAEIIEDFKTEGVDLHSHNFLSGFSYLFLRDPSKRKRVLDAALSPTHRSAIEQTIQAAYVNIHGLTLEGSVCHAVEDFLNYAIPRIAGMDDEAKVFEKLYTQFDNSMFGDSCLVTAFAVLSNVWDNSGRVVLPPGFSLRYVDKSFRGSAEHRFERDRAIPYFEIAKTAHPISRGREIKDQHSYFVFSYSTSLAKNRDLIPAAYALRDDIVRKFIFSVRLINFSAAFADYRGFRTIAHLSGYHLNLMNFPDDFVQDGDSFELGEHDGIWLRRLLRKLVNEKYSNILVLDSKIEDAIRRARETMLDETYTEMKVAIDRLLDYFQILEALVPVAGSEYIALYSAVLLKASGNGNFSDAFAQYKFIKRLHTVRNDVMHGRIDEVLNSKKITPGDVHTFRSMVYVLAGLFILNGKLREPATKLALGEPVTLDSIYKVTLEEMNEMRYQRTQSPEPPSW